MMNFLFQWFSSVFILQWSLSQNYKTRIEYKQHLLFPVNFHEFIHSFINRLINLPLGKGGVFPIYVTIRIFFYL